MRRTPYLFAAALAMLTLAGTSLAIPRVSAAPIAGAPVTYCGDPDTDPSIDTGAGTMVRCDTAITNTITGIDPVTGLASGSATISVTECTGPATGRLDPSFLTCSTDLETLVNLVTAVDQCNGVGYGGGNVLECSVSVINNFVGVTPEAVVAATVNQCNGSAPDTTGCNPYPASTTNATITQCNNSSYGGGQEDFNCSATGTTTSSLDVTVDQCNDSNYGGGSWLNCSASVTNNVIDGSSAPPSAAPTGSATGAPTNAPTDAPAGETGGAGQTAAPTQTVTITGQTSPGQSDAGADLLTLPETATGATGAQGAIPVGLVAALTLLAGSLVVSTVRMHKRRR